MNWRYSSEDIDSISLHDCDITAWEFEEDIVLSFEDGFDVCAENPLNDTGRHKRTGKSTVRLQNARFLRGTLYVSAKEEKPLYKDDIAALELEILDFKRHPDSVFLACDAWGTKHGDCYCEFEFACSGVTYYWNEFTDDAWFQE